MRRCSSEWTILPSGVQSLTRTRDPVVTLPITAWSIRRMAAASPPTRASVRLGTITLWASTSVTVRASSVAAVWAARRLTTAPAIPTATATTTLASANRVRARRVLVDPCACPADAGRSPMLIPPSPVRPGRRPCHHGRWLRTNTPVGRATSPTPPIPQDRSVVVAALALVVPGLGLAVAALVVAGLGLAAGGLGGGGVVLRLGLRLAALVVGDRLGRDRRLDRRGGGGRGHHHRDRDRRRHRDHADRRQDSLAHLLGSFRVAAWDTMVVPHPWSGPQLDLGRSTSGRRPGLVRPRSPCYRPLAPVVGSCSR